MATDTPRIALVTGAAQRIGRTLALDLAAAGWRVAVHYGRSSREAQAVVDEIAARGGRAAAVAADLGKEADLLTLMERAGSALDGAPTCLVNNASVFEQDDVAGLTPQSWDRHHTVNLRAPVLLSQALSRGLPSGVQGNVVNIVDQRVWRLTPEFFSYTISKAGLWAATQTMAQALAPRVRVNAIGPGPVLKSIHQSVQDFAAEESSTLLGRGTTPEEIAAAVRFILQSPAMTGQMIALDGGQHLEWRGVPSPGGSGSKTS